MLDSIFIPQESSRYLGFKKKILTQKILGFLLFVYIKKSRKKENFLYKNVITMTPISKRQRASFTYTKSKNNCETFIYTFKKPDTFQKARQFALRFYSQKA